MTKNNKPTNREIDVLNLLKYSMTNEKIGEKLHISHHTVHAHKDSLFKKLGVHDSLEAVIKGLKLGYISLDD